MSIMVQENTLSLLLLPTVRVTRLLALISYETTGHHFIRGSVWRRQWHPTPVFLPGESQGWAEPDGLPSMGSHRVGHD